ncbi:hypothetical protein Nepgr_008218 [Nepenthes gracilis]|uniref:protein-serine/threonine phosphatase n=1 Tax=Nepenthes gracilis TaxID=150966 RepID=A0AAD3S8B5_NEPGR|nr:hypothetical protein Nepgr_008218 [Nepenthes gracilis]
MLELCRRPLESCFGGGGGRNGGDDVVWQVRLRPYAFGDYSMAVVQANSPLEDQAQVVSSPYVTYVGVYDGHGGPDAALFIRRHLFSFLHQFATERGGLSTDSMRQALKATEEEFLKLVRRTWITDPHIALCGSCCLVGAISGGILYIANLGDSRAVLGRKVSDGRMFCSPSVLAERLTSDHNVGNEAVRKEVRELHPDDQNIVVYSRGFWRIKGIIQVSRTIGDIYLKCPEFSNLYKQFGSHVPLERAVVTAEPSILARQLKPDDMFLIFASDGLWEHISDEAAVEIVFRSPRTGIAKRLARAAVQEAARKRGMTCEDMKKIDKGVRRHFHDDITVVVVYLDHSQSPPNNQNSDHACFNSSVTPILWEGFSGRTTGKLSFSGGGGGNGSGGIGGGCFLCNCYTTG